MKKGNKIILIQLITFSVIFSAYALPSNSNSTVVNSSKLFNNFQNGSITASSSEVNTGIQAVNTSINNSNISNVNTGGTFYAENNGSKIYAGVTVDNGSIDNADISSTIDNANLEAVSGGEIYAGIYGKNIKSNDGSRITVSSKLNGSGEKIRADGNKMDLSVSGDNITSNVDQVINQSEINNSDIKTQMKSSTGNADISLGAVDFGNNNRALENNWEDNLKRNKKVEIGTVKVDGYNSNLEDINVKVGKNSMKIGESVMARNRAKRDSGTLPMGQEYVYVSKNDISNSVRSVGRTENVSVGNKTIGRHSRAERVNVYVE